MNRFLFISYGWLVTICLCALPFHDARAQPSGRRIGFGGQIGRPGALTVKYYRMAQTEPGILRPRAFALLTSWGLDDSFFINVRALDERLIPESPLRYFFGPGVLLGFTRKRPQRDLLAGISGTFGVNFFQARFEVHLQATPRLLFFPGVDFDVNAAVGLRYYF